MSAPAALQPFVPAVDWQAAAASASTHAGYQALIAGGGIFAVGLILRLGRQSLRLHRGEQPDWISPILHLICIVALLASYASWLPAAIHTVVAFGAHARGSDHLLALSQARVAALEIYAARQPQWTWLTFNAPLLEETLNLMALRWLQVGIQAALLCLQSVQIFALAAFTQAGPSVLALSYLAPTLGPFVRAWGLAIVEVASWSWWLTILTTTFRQSAPDKAAEAFSMTEELTASIATIVLIAAVPWIASSFRRGIMAAVGQGEQAAPSHPSAIYKEAAR